MLKTKSLLPLLASLLVASAAHAAPAAPAVPAAEAATEAAIKTTIEQRLHGAKVASVSPTPYAGLYELRIGDQIFYTDKGGQYLVEGNIFNTKTMQNLTKERVDALNQIKIADLPLDLAIKSVKGNGKRVMVLFEDPNCPYCKRLHKEALKQANNTTVYTFLYNVITEESAAKSKNIWCSPDRNKALEDWMVDAKVPATAAADCGTPNDAVLALGNKLHISGTPTIFFADGGRISGAPTAEALEARLALVK